MVLATFDKWQQFFASILIERASLLARAPCTSAGAGLPPHITRFQRPRAAAEPSSQDYDFSYDAITRHQAEGYDLVKRTLEDCPRLPIEPAAAPSTPTERRSRPNARAVPPKERSQHEPHLSL